MCLKAALEDGQKAQDCSIFQVRSAAVLPLPGLRNGYLDHYSVYDGGRCRSLVNTDTISGSIGAFCEKRMRMQVFFSSMDTALRSSFSLIVVMVLHSSSVPASISAWNECRITYAAQCK